MCEFEDNDSKGQDFENTFYTLMKHMLRIIAETQKMKNESRQHGRNCIHVGIYFGKNVFCISFFESISTCFVFLQF